MKKFTRQELQNIRSGAFENARNTSGWEYQTWLELAYISDKLDAISARRDSLSSTSPVEITKDSGWVNNNE